MKYANNLRQVELVEEATQTFLNWANASLSSVDSTFAQAKILATRLGAHYRSDGLTEIAFWVPETEPNIGEGKDGLQQAHCHQIKNSESVHLGVFTPLEPINFRAAEQNIHFQCNRLPLRNYQNFFCGVFSGMIAGTKERAGSFYCLYYRDSQNKLQRIDDIMAYSLPYGVFSAAELYDVEGLQQQRKDLDYFSCGLDAESLVTKVAPPRNILQLHVGTASEEGTIEGLTQIYRQIAAKLRIQAPLTPAEENYIGYDAVQLLPIEPVAEYHALDSWRPGFISWDETIASDADIVEVRLRKPDTQNWGYDIVLHASSATNPSILGSLRPDELIEFIATLHTFPTGPIKVIYDLVYGHSDNQAQALLNQYFLQGPNMYGQDVNFQHPIVRAILLEMQRRKINTGADGIRVDGAQDFKFFNSSTGKVEYDDAYLQEMSNVCQEIGGHQRQLFAIFEDGRPWPAKGWEESSTYLDVIKQQPEAYQWGPLIFAHNTPSLNNFWDLKWQRVCQVMDRGSHWISGCGNHDTMRRGSQLDPQGDINWNLGQTLPEVMKNAYDNPVVTLLFYGFSPGVPMDFLNATMRSPWCFFRNTDNYYGLKVVAEEVRFLDWQIDPALYEQDWAFSHIKQFGIDNFSDLHLFLDWLEENVLNMEDDYNLATLVAQCQQCLNTKGDKTQKYTVEMFKTFAKAYMEDCFELCKVTHCSAKLNPQQTSFNLAMRHYRHAHSWLRENLIAGDYLNRLSDRDQTIFYGLRSNCDRHKKIPSKQIAIIAHMGGNPTRINIGELLGLDLTQWQIAIATPGLELGDQLSQLTDLELRDSEGLLLESR